MHNVDYIICHKEKDINRRNNIIATTSFLRKYFPELTITIVEQGEKPVLQTPGIRIIFIYNNGAFNKSWAFNVGVKNTNKPIIAFGDADIIGDPNKLIEAAKLAEKVAVKPFELAYYLNPTMSAEVRKTLELPVMVPLQGQPEIGANIPFGGGLLFIKRDVHIQTGGWNEDFIGWGAEDNYQGEKIFNIIAHKNLPGYFFHLYHEGCENNPRLQDNLKILRETKFNREQILKEAPLLYEQGGKVP